MPSYNYDYIPLTNGQKWHIRNPSRLWQAGLVISFIAGAIATQLYNNSSRGVSSPLDNFQKLNQIPVVDSNAFPPASPHTPTHPNHDDHAVVSALYTDTFATAITTLGYSLTIANISARMILMYLPDRVSSRTLCLASAAGWTPHPVSFISPPHNSKGLRKYFKDQYTKLNLWKLDTLGIKSLVYLDADTLVRKNFDELFMLPFNFAAVPDVFEDSRGFSIGFNAGVLFLRPSTAIFDDMLSKLETADYPPKFAEQAFLNLYFGAQVIRLPYIYNGNLAIKKRSPKLWNALVEDLRIVHYTIEKPFPSQWLDHQELETFFDGRRTTHDGLWAKEMGWWANIWREMAQKQFLSRCT